MSINKSRNDSMIRLNQSFFNKLFLKLSNKFSSSKKASELLGIPYSSFRGYKNGYFSSLPEFLFNKIGELAVISKKEMEANILERYSLNERTKKILNNGREKRNKIIQGLKNEVPEVKEILNRHDVSLERWFDKYRFLVSCGFRKVKVDKSEKEIIIVYNNYTRGGFKKFRVFIPKRIKLDDEFAYFFGLWCGDRAGGKRFGICNQNQEIIDFTKMFLKRYNQKIEKILYIKKGLKEPKIEYNKKFSFDKEINGWVLSVHSNNGIFSSFFHYLQKDIEEVLKRINKYAFLAGLFDAEGNVSLYNKSFRWSCKNAHLIEVYTKLLKSLNLYHKYDGGNLVSYNQAAFYDEIFPYLKHSKKRNLTSLMCSGAGDLPDNYGDILAFIQKNPSVSAAEIAKALKKTKVYSELGLLLECELIFRVDYPNKYMTTNKGTKVLGSITS
jgi:hypothetical protein